MVLKTKLCSKTPSTTFCCDRMEIHGRSCKHFLTAHCIHVSSEEMQTWWETNWKSVSFIVLHRMTNQNRKMLFLRGELVQTGAPLVETLGIFSPNFWKMFSSSQSFKILGTSASFYLVRDTLSVAFWQKVTLWKVLPYFSLFFLSAVAQIFYLIYPCLLRWE